MFSVLPVVCGQTVWRFVPQFDLEFGPEEMTALGEAERQFLRRYTYLSRFTGRYVLPGDHDRFMNHADTPNVGINPDGSFTCIALRDISANEELTTDYSTFDFDWRLKLPG